jgi:hypothetical protein
MNADTTGVLWKCLPMKKLALNLHFMHLCISQVRSELLCYDVPLLTIHLKLGFVISKAENLHSLKGTESKNMPDGYI